MKTFGDNELIVDNFAGGGGASKGIEHALHRQVDMAVNHDEIAIAMHKANHPSTKHMCEDIWEIDPKEACEGRPVGLAWFSPDCTHFSRARGGKPVKKSIRGLAWVVTRWAKEVAPRMIMLENVEEFKTWGPLIKQKDGNYLVDKEKKGQTFEKFIKSLEKLGYDVEWNSLRACDYGSPTIRKRLFIVARNDEEPINWPKPTHGNPISDEVQNGDLDPWHTAAECIQWDLACPSIFERKKPLADATHKRIAKGIVKYVLEDSNPFIVPIAHYNGRDLAYDIEKPMNTITARPKGGSFALARPFIGSYHKSEEFRGQSVEEPLATQDTANRHALICANIMMNQNNNVGSSMKEPTKTITSGNHHYLISSFLHKYYTGVIGSKLSEPVPTVTSIDHNSLVESHLSQSANNHAEKIVAFLMEYYGNGQPNSIKNPMHTVTSKDRFALINVKGLDYYLTDIGLRMLAPRELFRAQGFPDSYIIDRDVNKNPITKVAQVALCGNSVCPDLARALVQANTEPKENPNAEVFREEPYHYQSTL